MNIKPLVSIVIPVYNGEKYIEEAIGSLLNQEYPNIELIVLDDGSTDNTAEILSQYEGQLHWESHENMGQAATLNKGWLMAKGQILSYLSADDKLMPNAVSTSVKYLQEHPEVAMTYCDFNLIDPQSKIIRRVNPPDFSYYDMVVKMYCHPGPGIFFRRSAFEKAGLWNSAYKQMPDYEYWLRLGLTGKFYHIHELLASFRVHNQSQSFAKGDPIKSDEPVRIMTEYFQMTNIPKYIMEAEDKAMSNAYLTSAQLHWRAGRFTSARDMLKRAIRADYKSLLSIRALRVIVNALVNRFAHRALWSVRNLFKTSKL